MGQREVDFGGKTVAPRWLIDRIGVDYFDHVTYVFLPPSGADAAAIARVGRLTGLQTLFHVNCSGIVILGLSVSAGAGFARPRLGIAQKPDRKPRQGRVRPLVTWRTGPMTIRTL